MTCTSTIYLLAYVFGSLIFLFLFFHTAAGPLDKPVAVKTHLRNMIIVPEMIGSQVAVYNGKVFNLVLITADMVGMYLGEFSITYRCVTFSFTNAS